jgi:hypothetical protein
MVADYIFIDGAKLRNTPAEWPESIVAGKSTHVEKFLRRMLSI